ncbi:MAG: hypothetical protein IKE46_08370 [Selenomonadaceae bacterium]|nr:hypothetical protein [Selenomonadaceae bacterium]
MTTKEVLEQLKLINQEKILASFHDDALYQNFPDIDALDAAILLIDFLAKKKPSDKVTVAEIFKEADIDY